MKLFFKIATTFNSMLGMRLKIGLVFLLVFVFTFIWLVTATLEKQKIYQVKSGVGFSQVSKELNSLPMLILSKIMPINLKVGYYQIEAGMSVIQLLKNFDTAQVKTANITLIEGQTIDEYFHQLSQNSALKKKQTLDQIMQKIDAQKPYEGRFFPETYRVNYGDSVQSIFQRAYQAMQQKMQDIWQKRHKNLPLKTPYEFIILASLIEKESADVAEKPKIARVFINRLNKNMRLQADPSVIYALGNQYQGLLSKADLKINSPFNTYRHKGLPPSAIANPSLSSLIAASQPYKSDHLYFVAKKEGRHVFAKTYKQHQDNINQYLKNR